MLKGRKSSPPKKPQRPPINWQPQISYPEALPISAGSQEIVQAIQRNPVVIIAGETGSGKTTQIPKMCLEAGLLQKGIIACTQPRRVAALSISRRIAEELNTPWGEHVGAKIRFTDKTTRETAIKVMTDGVLLNEVQFDPQLRDYSAIIIDEAHERSLNIDFLLGHLNRIRHHRPELRIIITSATIDTAAFSKSFDDAPIIEVSGRTYPVDVFYTPVDELLEDRGDFTVIDAMAEAIERIVSENKSGDVLGFLSGEKDIRETNDLLKAKSLGNVEILPLFGRLSNDDQQRIFQSSNRRKIILSTNIAETSLTIPGIRYVVDSGMARISRYHPQTHTLRLPIERIAKSSADQRKGRAGRVANGICIRLYSEQDFASRPDFTTPEIMRSNLASVILRMLAFGLGEIDTFPFINPPHPRNVQAGYQLLHQLGAIDDTNKLTHIGKQLARLPVDPTVGRMILQAQKEGCLEPVMAIASALSIQDPRERPSEASAEADQMHRTFQHPKSDFLCLLNIWNSYHDKMERLSQAQLRKFCKKHFLSYLRMREWRDIYRQIHSSLPREWAKNHAVTDGVTSPKNEYSAIEYQQIHRSLLAGLLHGVAEKDDGNTFRMAHGRLVNLFPGSALFDRKVAKEQYKKKPAKNLKSTTPEWIVSAEIVETSRIFARTAAHIEPAWIAEIGSHLVTLKHSEPNWDQRSERVYVRERSLLYGLEVAVRKRNYIDINAEKATRIFIRCALIEGQVRHKPAFLEQNLKLQEQIENLQTRIRSLNTWTLEERIEEFYAQRIKQVGSMRDLQQFIRQQLNGNDQSLIMVMEDLVDPEGLHGNTESFPESVEFGSNRLQIDYAYKPGDEADGPTLKLPIEALQHFDPEKLDWIVPGLMEERTLCLLRSLPKDMRRFLIPLADKAKKACLSLNPDSGPLLVQLSKWLNEHYQISPRPSDWNPEAIPAHLRPRVEVVDAQNKVISAGRDWEKVQASVEAIRHGSDSEQNDQQRRLKIWAEARKRIERTGLQAWDFGDFPQSITIGDIRGLPIPAYPGLSWENGDISLRLFIQPEEAEKQTRRGIFQLAMYCMGRDLGWLEKELGKEIRRVQWLAAPIQSSESLTAQCKALIWRYLFASSQVLPLEKQRFKGLLAQAKERSRGIIPQTVDLLETLFSEWSEIKNCHKDFPPAIATLDGLIYNGFLNDLKWPRLKEYPRYLKAIHLRAQRAKINPLKDREKAERIIPYIKALNAIRTNTAASRKLRWLIEEFRVQTFAQELGTHEKVSEKRLKEAVEELKAD